MSSLGLKRKSLVEHDAQPRKYSPTEGAVSLAVLGSQNGSTRHSHGQMSSYSNRDTPQTNHRALQYERASPALATDNDSWPSTRKFRLNSSIVLIGIRGTGKSSLAVILAAASGRQLIDSDQYFRQVSGCSRAEFKKDNDHAIFQQQEALVLESMLWDNQEGCIIVCGAGTMERRGQKLLREYALTHPIIHVVRDPESIQSYLKAWDTQKVSHFLQIAGPIYRSCSNLEFFNLSETVPRGGTNTTPSEQDSSLESQIDQRPQASTPFLTLKKIQRDFLSFVAFITDDREETGRQQASFPLSLLPVESRRNTLALSVPFSALCETSVDIEELEYNVDAVELVIDVVEHTAQAASDLDLADKISHAVALIRRHTIVPLIYHVESYVRPRRPASANRNERVSDREYSALVQQGLRLGPSFLTIDLDRDKTLLAKVIRSCGNTKIIGHFESRQPFPGGWDGDECLRIYERAQKLGCDMLRICQPAMKVEDNDAVQRFRHKVQNLPIRAIPVIAYNTGPLGRMSRCFNPILTPVTHSHFGKSSGLVDSDVTAVAVQKALYSSFVYDPMQYFVFGANVSYSMSPAMHNAAFEVCGMPHRYSIFQSAELRGLNELVENPYFGGSSVSLPYKTEVIPLLHSMSPHARAIGAVNTIIPLRNNDLADARVSEVSSIHLERTRAGPVRGIHGDNTDWIGICNCIRRGLSPANAIRQTTTGLVIGSGGMARAAIYSMIHLGVRNIFVYNRTVAKAERLAEHYNRQDLFSQGRRPEDRPRVRILSHPDDPWPVAFKQPTIIVSGIPAHSIAGEPAPNFNVPTQWLESPTGGVVVDLAYKPLNTPLMKQIRALSHRGWVALDGLDVLPEQGFAQFELFTGRRAPRRLMRTIVLQEYEDDEVHDDRNAIQYRLRNLDGQLT
ncbi:Quinate repressor protein [Penicillium diatomitis]|uniref:Quinate repressor protein n=1 Tax=Penicillium diatomitis TaxID=2819901 RepID=A0A9W9XDD8_9EURO|nr:Quinate repressor protein [Penicillium diatomitis]KAJ5489227.1 Quinate repressor protein [Penicillium diatomitis]